MKIRVGGQLVDVVDALCASRPCFHLGFDKGTFVQGRGYTSYHKVAEAVCQTRHLHGCPDDWVCAHPCRTIQIPLVSVCRLCGAVRPPDLVDGVDSEIGGTR